MRKLSRIKKIILLSAVFFTLMILVAIFSDSGILAVSEFKQDLLELKKEDQALEKENARIRRDIQALKFEPYAIEKVAREHLNMAKPGETIYRIVRKSKNPLSAPADK
ncbi:MAG: septum formation initiator family protein [Nitrospinales bacterium]